MSENSIAFLNEIASGYQKSKILLTGCELGVFDLIKQGKNTALSMAGALGCKLYGIEILLDALCAINILKKQGNRYENIKEFEPYLTEGGNTHYLSLFLHRNLCFKNWAFLEEKILGKASGIIETSRDVIKEKKVNENFIKAMFAAGYERSLEVMKHIDLDGVKIACDLGGGPGHFCMRFIEKKPDIFMYLVDLPITLKVASEILENFKVKEKVKLVEWDFYHSEPPDDLPEFDLVFISQVIHSEPPEKNIELFKKVHSIVKKGGRLIISENIVNEDRTSPEASAIFAVNMLAMTDGGRTYTVSEIKGWLENAGFLFSKNIPVDERTHLVFAHKK